MLTVTTDDGEFEDGEVSWSLAHTRPLAQTVPSNPHAPVSAVLQTPRPSQSHWNSHQDILYAGQQTIIRNPSHLNYIQQIQTRNPESSWTPQEEVYFEDEEVDWGPIVGESILEHTPHRGNPHHRSVTLSTPLWRRQTLFIHQTKSDVDSPVKNVQKVNELENKSQIYAEAVSRIERSWLAYRLRKELGLRSLKRSAAIRIQSIYRMILCKRQYVRNNHRLHMVEHMAAIKIQSFCKLFIHRRYYLKLRSATLVVQKHFRAKLQIREARHILEMKRENLIKKRRENAVIILQSLWRGKKCRREFIHIIKSIGLIQRIYRQYRVRAQTKIINATTKIQSFWRMIRQQHKFKMLIREKNIAAVEIQKHWKCFKVRKQYLNIKSAAIKIQRFYRNFIIRKKYQIQVANDTTTLLSQKTVLISTKSPKANSTFEISSNPPNVSHITAAFEAIPSVKESKEQEIMTKKQKLLEVRKQRMLISQKVQQFQGAPTTVTSISNIESNEIIPSTPPKTTKTSLPVPPQLIRKVLPSDTISNLQPTSTIVKPAPSSISQIPTLSAAPVIPETPRLATRSSLRMATSTSMKTAAVVTASKATGKDRPICPLDIMDQRSIQLLTLDNTNKNAGYMTITLKVNEIFMNTKRPPSPSAKLKSQFEEKTNSSDIAKAAEPVNHPSQKLRWNPNLIMEQELPAAGTSDLNPRKKSCIKPSKPVPPSLPPTDKSSMVVEVRRLIFLESDEEDEPEPPPPPPTPKMKKPTPKSPGPARVAVKKKGSMNAVEEQKDILRPDPPTTPRVSSTMSGPARVVVKKKSETTPMKSKALRVKAK